MSLIVAVCTAEGIAMSADTRATDSYLNPAGDSTEGRPAAIVVLEESWPDAEFGYERLETFPRLLEYLARAYAPPLERPGYRIYAKRSDS